MKFFRKHKRTILRVLGTLLVLGGLYVAYWWFYKLAPRRRAYDWNWRATHSKAEYWREAQKTIHREGWSFHDDFQPVALYGDKSWAEWIMARVKPGESMDCMGYPCHSATVMRCITNQDVGDDADAWLAWWEVNKAKSQEEWMIDGFRKYDIDPSIPPSSRNIVSLLELLGNSETDEASAVPWHVKYNAFRWLRDSDFDPVAFAVANMADSISEKTKRGLLEYQKRERRWPKVSRVGILPFGREQTDYSQWAVLSLLTPRFRWTAYAVTFLPMLAGVCLIAWSFRRAKKKKNVEPPSAPDSE